MKHTTYYIVTCCYMLLHVIIYMWNVYILFCSNLRGELVLVKHLRSRILAIHGIHWDPQILRGNYGVVLPREPVAQELFVCLDYSLFPKGRHCAEHLHVSYADRSRWSKTSLMALWVIWWLMGVQGHISRLKKRLISRSNFWTTHMTRPVVEFSVCSSPVISQWTNSISDCQCLDSGCCVLQLPHVTIVKQRGQSSHRRWHRWRRDVVRTMLQRGFTHRKAMVIWLSTHLQHPQCGYWL